MANTNDRAHAAQAPPSRAPVEFHFLTDEVPESDRLGIFREVFGQQMLRLDVESVPDYPFRVDAVVRSLPGLDAVWALSSPMRVSRTRQLLSDGNDNLIFQWADTAGFCEHLGRDIALGPGDAVVLSCSDIGSVTFPGSGNLISVGVPRAILGPLLRDADACLARPVSRDSSALRLLTRYLEILRDESTVSTLELQTLAVTHVYDLLAIVLGPTSDAAERAKKRGARAARLLTIKADMEANLANAGLSIADLAARHGMTPRSLQTLFGEDGTTFTDLLRMQRLSRAYRMLVSRRFGDHRIADIALACGFGDISYFNREFRARFGSTPSDVRNRRRE